MLLHATVFAELALAASAVQIHPKNSSTDVLKAGFAALHMTGLCAWADGWKTWTVGSYTMEKRHVSNASRFDAHAKTVPPDSRNGGRSSRVKVDRKWPC